MTRQLLFVPLLFLLSCGGDSSTENEETETEDDVKIKAYCEENDLDAVRQESGLYIYVEKEGGAEKPTGDSYITLIYDGYLLDGTLFESTSGNAIPSGVPLDYYIPGWQEGIPHFGKGGKGTMIIPPALGFGKEGKGSIPGNSILVFDLELVDFSLDPPPAPDYSEEINSYCELNNIDTADAIITESGLYVLIDKEGGSAKPTVHDYVTIHYKGTLTNGKPFDGTTDAPASFLLSGLIEGWKEGIPYFGKGGNGTLIIPPYLGYGPNDVGDIPGNSVLIFKIELVDFSPVPPEGQ